MTDLITQSEFTELRTEIRNGFQAIGDRLERLETGQTEIDKRLSNLETSVNNKFEGMDKRLSNVEASVQKIPELSEKVGELKNWKQIGLVVITALVSSFLTGTIGGFIGWFLRGSRI